MERNQAPNLVSITFFPNCNCWLLIWASLAQSLLNSVNFEPAVAITHSDGNPSTILRYVSSEQKTVTGGTETIINLKACAKVNKAISSRNSFFMLFWVIIIGY